MEDADILKLQKLFKLSDEKIKDYSTSLNKIESASFERKRTNSFNQKRSDMEKFASILQTSEEGVNKTRILYHANLSESIFYDKERELISQPRKEISCMVYEEGII